MRYSNLIKILNETSTSGSTGAASIATCINSNFPMLKRPSYEGSLGVGFNPNGHKGIYNDLKENLDSIKSQWDDLGIESYMTERNDYIILSKIVIPEENRNNGIGTKAMNLLCEYADTNNKIIACTPDSSYGGKLTKLKSFYKKFGFIENKGKNRDFYINESYIRYPK